MKNELVQLDVMALLDRLDEVSPPPKGVRQRHGGWLVDRSWRLKVIVLPDHRYCGNDVWKPGISIDCCDAQGSFRTPGLFVEFEECWFTPSQIERMYRFIERWQQRRQRSDDSRRLQRWSGKVRDDLIDCLPTNRAEWDEQPAAVEQAYRRGFAQGVSQAYYAFRDGARLRRIEKWLIGRVNRWRYQDTMRPSFPPERPS